jgi:hypothetical protein
LGCLEATATATANSNGNGNDNRNSNRNDNGNDNDNDNRNSNRNDNGNDNRNSNRNGNGNDNGNRRSFDFVVRKSANNFAQDDTVFGWASRIRTRLAGEGIHSHLSDDETVAKMGHPYVCDG